MRTFVLSMFWLYIVTAMVTMIQIHHKKKINKTEITTLFVFTIVISWALILLW